ncbi:MAG: hypothetical protein JWM74_2348, partial [Myxococcaceae bacterium]|nr:hypothetical protein [Myxococcaceae bacterium]
RPFVTHAAPTTLPRYDGHVMSGERDSLTLPFRLGRYELIAPIGRGGMATVFLARMHGTAGFARIVAVKLLHTQLLQDRELVTMFLDEARLAARIRHANVIEVYDVELIDSELAIIMSWIEGGSLTVLSRALPADEPMPLPLATRIVHDALLGLHAAHELETDDGHPAGLVHRDVSPPNILVGVDGTTYLTDFGVAKAAGRLNSTGENSIKGKLAYMAPEQLSGDAVDRRTDVFASGVVLWELLAGQSLFAHGAGDRETVMLNVLEMPIPPPGTHRPGVPLSLDEVCMRALERDPARRYPTAAAFASALDEAYGRKMMPVREVGELVTARLAGSIERQKLALRRASAEPAPASPLATATTTGAMAPPPVVPAGVLAKRPALGALAAVAAGMLGVIALASVIAFFLRAPAAPPQAQPSPIVTTIVATAEPTVPPAVTTSVPSPRATSAAPVSTARRTHPRGGNKKTLPAGSTTGTFTPSEP